jgi:ubiquinone/menaquinone biosynthesis C-methylase UbiE
MERIPEPELMDDPQRAQAYAQADFSEPHQAFVDRYGECFPAHRPSRVLDLGCGPADVTLRFARAYPNCQLLGMDGALPMLNLARTAVGTAGLEGRVGLVLGYLPEAAIPPQAFDTVISNSLLHHLTDPMDLWQAIMLAAEPGACVFVMDLRRPNSRAQADELARIHAAGEPEILRRDFLNSLLAAYRPDEVIEQLRRMNLALTVDSVDDRHLVVYGRLD